MKKIIILLLLCGLKSHAQTSRVLIVGDSWAEQQFEDGSHVAVFSNNGYFDINVVGSSTTQSGSEASGWAAPSELKKIGDALAAHPDIDTVQLTIGGNDFLNNWSINMSSKQEMALQQQIQSDITTIVEFILAQDTKIEIVLSFYDYPNFVDTLGGLSGLVCAPLLKDLGTPSSALLNNAITQYENIYAQIATEHSRVYHVTHLGLMQYFYSNIPRPGDLSLPSPVAALRTHPPFESLDCFHLNPVSYEVLVQNLFDNYYLVRFDTVFKSGFE